jgi:hypothetical protein
MGLTLNANLDEMRELAKALSDESSACDALIEKTALHLISPNLLTLPINMILINAEPNTKN